MTNRQLRTVVVASLAGVLLVCLTLLLILGPPDWPTRLEAAGAALLTLATGVVAVWRALPDSDGDGWPDPIDSTPNGEEE